MTSRPLALLGHFGGWNAGDEAILASMVRETRAVDAEISIDVLVSRLNNGGPALAVVPGVRYIEWNSVAAVRAVTRDRLVVGGGQVIAGDRSLKGLVVTLGFATLNRLCGRRPAMAFAGVVGLDRRRARWLARVLCYVLNDVSVRDAASQRQLSDAGVPSRDIDVVPDVVLGGTLGRCLRPADGIVGTSVVVVGHRSPDRHLVSEDDMADIVEALVERFAGSAPGEPHRNVIVQSHDVRIAFDNGLVERIQDVVPGADARRLTDLDSLARTYQGAAVVVSARMHPLIFAAIAGIPAVALAGSSKVAEVAGSLGMALVPTDDPVAVVAAVAAALDGDGVRPVAGSAEQIRNEITSLLE